MIRLWKIGLKLRGGSHVGNINNLMIGYDISEAIREPLSDEGNEMKKNVKALRECEDCNNIWRLNVSTLKFNMVKHG